MSGKPVTLFVLIVVSSLFSFPAQGGATYEDSYVEPGSLRLSHEITLEGILHKLRRGWKASPSSKDRREKVFSQEGNEDNPWKAQWGERLLTDVTARLSRDVSARVLFEAQGEYADRFWRPVNIRHDKKLKDEILILRQAEGRIEKDHWHLYGFSGVPRNDWRAYGDFFGLYPESIPQRDYLGSSGYFGVHPNSWKQDQYLNISRRHVPRGGEWGGTYHDIEVVTAFGRELAWGFDNSFYGRLRAPFRSTQFTFLYRNEDVPYAFEDKDERKNSYSLVWEVPHGEGHQLTVGALYQPFRSGQTYQVADDVSAGEGLLGSSTRIGQKTTQAEDGLGGRIRYERHDDLFNRTWVWALDLSHLGLLAGNKRELDVEAGTDITSLIRWSSKYKYRKPVEGPIPFLFEGSPTNIGAIAASPRGPQSPFTVDWSNREAVFLETTLWIDPTPGTNMFLYDPTVLSGWNVNSKEDSSFAIALQHRMSDYRTTTDRQYYTNEFGDIVWESAAHSGAWATKHPLHEFRAIALGRLNEAQWMLGVAGGQSAAILGLAYSNDPTSPNKPITEYISFEGKLKIDPVSLWAHYGSGVWGPEENTDPFFGNSIDRLWGGGISYKITRNTTWDIGYLALRQDDDLFVPSNLGSYDEIRTLFSHRFGFLFQFSEPRRGGFRTQ